MQYYASDDRKGKVWAAAATLLAYLVCLVLLLVIKFHLPQQATEGEGIMINFGDVAEAGGEHDTAMTDDAAATPSQPQPDPTPNVTADHGDVEVPRQQRPTAQAQPAEPVRTPDPRGSFRLPGRTAGSTSTSEGTGAGAGNQGNPAGTAEGSHDGTGTGTSGASANLKGRSPVGELPMPDYNSRRAGRVVVEITVNPAGQVTSAIPRPTESLGADNVMIDDALRAARKARFNNVEADGPQTGTITYIFSLKMK